MRLYLAVLLLAGCSNDEPAPLFDAGVDTDSGSLDAGRTDSGPADSGDAGPPFVVEAQLFEMLLGRFDSTAQAAQDPQYFEISLVACEVNAPTLGPRVLYLEQAVMTALDRPYRQRLYVVERQDERTAVSNVYTILDEAAWVGACDETAVRAVDASEAQERAGCAVTVTWDAGRFVGGTDGKDCASSLQGASYATSEVTLYEDRIESWDRGFDASDTQVWGATAGPYLFDRQ